MSSLNRATFVVTVVGGLLLVLPVLRAVGGGAAVAGVQTASDSFAVVELFTSEGCSSCPAADAVLADLVAEARKSGKRVFPLAFHVDYWNRLGWVDHFSDAAYSRRQSDYARARGTEQIYTPEMFVNGGTDFVGSDAANAKRLIDAALATPAPAHVSIQIAQAEAGSHRIDYTVTGQFDGAAVNIAVVERGLSTKVRGGENSGRTLKHENAVRWFSSINAANDVKGHADIPALRDVNWKMASVIVYVQEHGTGRVLGAAGADIP
jgi:hypothetical protein